jgi:DNA polymerase I-like protein with 3'-5' exonuclease and polymerase domains
MVGEYPRVGSWRISVSASKAEKAAGWLQTPLWEPELTWKATSVSQLPAWADAKRVCVDVECRDDYLHALGPGVRRDGYVCGVAFAIEDGPAHYLPIRHEGGGNLAPEHVWAYLREQAAAFCGEMVFNSAPYDLDYLWENKVEFTKASAHRDVQVAEPLLDELQKKYGLDAICARRGLVGKDENKLREHAKAWGIDPKTGLWRLHAGAVGNYAIGDVRAPLVLLRAQEKELEEQNLRETYDLESAVTPALVRMTRRGLRVDLDELDRVEAWAKERLNVCLERIHCLTGVKIGSISNATEVAKALRKHGVEVPQKVHGGTGKQMYSVQKLWLQQQTDEVSKAIITGREFAKLLSTYVGGFRKHLVGNRLNPTFKQLVGASDEDEDGGDEEGDSSGARFGRCSAKHPNVQAQMKRSKDIQKRFRKVLVADEGKEWISGDFCYSADTEVLTRQGWQRFDALDSMLGEEVAQWQDGLISFVKPQAYYRSHFTGNLVQVDGRAVKFAVTPSHDLVFIDTTGTTRKIKAETLIKGVPCKWRFVSAGRLQGGLAEDSDLLRLVAAIQADATDRGMAWRFWLSREDKVARVPYLLDRLGIAFSTGFSEAKGNQTFFQFGHNARIDRYLSREDKTFKLEAFLSLDEASREAFLKELPFWDGQRDKGSYCSTNLTNCEVVQILAVITGHRSNTHTYQWKEDRKLLGVTHLSSRWYSGVAKLEVKSLAYDGEVFCVSVPSGAIVTRRNGSPVILGNSQQEPRWTIHYSEICKLPGAHAAGNTLRTDPLYDCYQMLVELVKSAKDTDLGKLRDELKEVYLGRCYGMGGGKLAHKLKLPTTWKTNARTGFTYEAAGEEAQSIIDRFDRGVPYVKALARACTKSAQSKGYILGIDNRRVRFELMNDGKLKDEHKALNKLIQYAAAWQTKKALVQLDAEGFPLQLTVHDEFDYSDDDDDRARHMAEVMCEVYRLRVPSRVDVKKGRSYGELEKLCTVTSKGFST